MIDAAAALTRTLFVAALFASLALALAPEGRGKAALKWCCGLMLCLAVAQSATKLRPEVLAEAAAEQRLLAERFALEQEETAWQLYRSIIQTETEAYIWKQAEALGVKALRLRLTLRDGTHCPYPYAISLQGAFTQAQQAELSGLLEGELGIPRERQQWSSSNVD